MRLSRALTATLLLLLAAIRCGAQQDVAVEASGEVSRAGARLPDVLLVTLDTTRNDFIGAYGADDVATPAMDRIAAAGVRYERAITAAPVTLPAHASLLTGLTPPEHGLRDNGIGRLPSEIPTLAETFSAAGYQTAAFVASRVLDRRFGLDRGFDHYGDEMAADQVGEYGYAERNAVAVTEDALAWLSSRDADRPSFLWVHYYDPHSPYRPAGGAPGQSERSLYGGEIEDVDRQIDRLLKASRGTWTESVIAVVADHGEALGEHGERSHGVLLYRAVLEVPMLISAPGVTAAVVTEPVATRRLGATLAAIAGLQHGPAEDVLPVVRAAAASPPIFSETLLPATAYGWSPMTSISEGPWRYVDAPRPELFDVVSDPAEATNLLSDRPEVGARLSSALAALQAGFEGRRAEAVEPDAELRASLESLGYLSGATAGTGDVDGTGELDGAIDPKEGILWLEDFQAAKRKLGAGDAAGALRDLERLVRRNPDNVPFLNNLAHAQRTVGQGEKAIDTYRRAAALNPTQDFVHVNLGDALAGMERFDEAIAEYRLALEFDPRQLSAWQRLSEIELARRDVPAARRILEDAVAAGVTSAILWTQLAVLQNATGDVDAARASARSATDVQPDFGPGWLFGGQLAAAAGDRVFARQAFERVIELEPGSHLGAEARRLLGALR